MTPLRLSHTWYRRLYVGLFLLSLIYIGVYALQQYSAVVMPESLNVTLIVAAVAALVALGSVLGFFAVKKTSPLVPAFITYALLTTATALLVVQTGGVASYFLAIWTLLIFFAPVFGAYGWLPVLVSIGVYIASTYLGATLTAETAVLIVLSSVVPLVAGMIIWRDSTGTEDASEKNVKNLANQLSEVAQTSEIVINAIGDGVIALDGKGIIQLINPAAQKILGWGKQDALMLNYKSILKLVDENNAELTPGQNPILEVLNNNQQARNNHLVAVTQSGKKINVSVVVSPIGNPGSGAIAVFRDITNERAEEREQAEFISTASHEMRTPVASIEGYLGLILNPNTAQIDQRARDFVNKAHEAAQHLGRLFQDLLDVSKSEDGRMKNTPRVVDLVAYTQTITQGLSSKAADKGLQLIFKPTESGNSATRNIMPVYYVNQDNDHIREIIDNLIENAIKYTPQGTVTIDITGDEGTVVVSIKDTGLGIPPEDLPHLFQKFYRVDNADRQAIGGTGLGLYLARRLAEAMQGRLWVDSKFGEGSTFFLELPRISTQEATHLKEEQDKQRLQNPAPTTVEAPVDPAVPTETAAAAPVAPAEPASPVVPAQEPASVPTAASTPSPAPASTTQTQPTTPTPAPAPAPTPIAAPNASQPAPQTRTVNTARPATTVPRGESLTREQIAERVRQLEELAKQQRSATTQEKQ